MNNKTLLENLRCIPDFPRKGINFRDVTTLYKNAECMQIMLDEMYELYKDKGITKIVGVESRGFVMAAALAARLKAGVVLARKPGKLPSTVIKESFSKEYGVDTVEIGGRTVVEDGRVVPDVPVAVDGGTLAFDTPTALTNFTATAGTFKFGAGALPLAADTKIDLGASGTLDLDYSGEAVVKELWANGRQCQAGTYSATSGHLVSSGISGTGALVVLEGKASGTVLIIR